MYAQNLRPRPGNSVFHSLRRFNLIGEKRLECRSCEKPQHSISIYIFLPDQLPESPVGSCWNRSTPGAASLVLIDCDPFSTAQISRPLNIVSGTRSVIDRENNLLPDFFNGDDGQVGIVSGGHHTIRIGKEKMRVRRLPGCESITSSRTRR